MQYKIYTKIDIFVTNFCQFNGIGIFVIGIGNFVIGKIGKVFKLIYKY